MLSEAEQNKLKQEAANQAAAQLVSGMTLGVGTGSTVKYFIDALTRRRDEDGLSLAAIVTTSNRSKEALQAKGFKVSGLSDVELLDLTVDGADRVDRHLDGIKGGGGALTMEKNVATYSRHCTWIVDESKVVDHLSGFPLPVEVLRNTCEHLYRKFADENLEPEFRKDADGRRFMTHYGNYIIDLHVDPIPVPAGLALWLDTTVGVVEHGLFLNVADKVIIAHEDGHIETRTR